MFCKNCGKEIESGELCEFCQSNLQLQQQEVQVKEVSAETVVSENNEPQPPKSKLPLIIGIISLVFAAILFIIFNVFVLQYNIKYGFNIIKNRQMYFDYVDKIKGNSKTIFCLSFIPLLTGVVSLILSILEKKKGYPIKRYIIISLIAIYLAFFIISSYILNILLSSLYIVIIFLY